MNNNRNVLYSYEVGKAYISNRNRRFKELERTSLYVEVAATAVLLFATFGVLWLLCFV